MQAIVVTIRMSCGQTVSSPSVMPGVMQSSMSRCRKDTATVDAMPAITMQTRTTVRRAR